MEVVGQEGDGGRGVLEQQLEGLIETLRQLGVTVEEFTETSQPAFTAKLLQAVQQMQALESTHHDCDDEDIPMAVFKYIDEGANPDLYVKDLLDTCISTNEATKGKQESFEYLQHVLTEEMKTLYPGLLDDPLPF
eukprot:TRINITY_DN14308_c0_g1_i1.p1 TRINITY_DN14308_c0_g1~~TRINITY_DN14308_c0_g1_i1.p1  ORF type:complete len:135 (+),score=30.99 TRINITY_DN14308_c0_g1_i1:479-883(+)